MNDKKNLESAFFWTWLFFGTHFLILSPASIFFKNLDFAISKSVVLMSFALVLFLLISSGFIISKYFLKPKAWQQSLVTFIFLLGLFSWIETTANPIYYGPLNGHFIHWEQWTYILFIEGGLAAVLLFGAYYFRRWLLRSGLKNLSQILILSQVVFVLKTYIDYPSDQKMTWKTHAISQDSKYAFSTDKNLIVIVVDTYQSNVFEKIVNKDKSYKEIFKDFTYYPDTAGGFRETAPSIPYLLSGEQYKNVGTLYEFSRKALQNKNNLVSLLKKDNFEVEFYPLLKNLIPLDLAANARELKLTDWIANLKAIVKLAVIKGSPQILKQYFYDNYFNSMDDRRFAEEVQTNFQLSKSKKFKYFHLWGTHNPNYLNENLEDQEPVYSEASYESQAKAELKILQKFLDKLRTEGVYDNSVIAIVADHGSGNLGKIDQIDESKYQLSNYAPDYVIGASNPLLLVKKLNDRGEFKVSQMPLSFKEVSSSLAYEVTEKNLEGSIFRGNSMNPINERKFYLYDLNLSKGRTIENTSTLGNFANLKSYTIKGPIRDRSSWSFNGYFHEGKINPLNYNYTQFNEIKFGDEYANDHWLGGGWSLIEDEGVWSESPWAQIKVPNLKVAQFVVELTISSVNKKQIFDVYDQDKKFIARNFIYSPGKYTFIVNGTADDSTTVPLLFHFPYAKESKLQGDVDSRRRGIFLSGIKAYPLPPIPTNFVVSLSNIGPGSIYLNNSWATPESQGTWTAGEWNNLIIPHSESMKGGILELQAEAVISKQFIEFYCGSYLLGQVHLSKSKPVRIAMNPRCINDGFFEVTIRVPTRAKAQMDDDEYRELGVYFSSFRVTSPKELLTGELLKFNLDSQAHEYLGAGWSFREKMGIWSVGPKSTLLFSHKDFSLPATLELDVESPQGMSQELTILVNNSIVQNVTFSGPSKISIPLTSHIMDGGLYRIKFESKIQQLDAESRPLAFFLKSMKLKKPEVYHLGKLLKLNNQVDQSLTLTKGWSPSEQEGTWNSDTTFSLELYLSEVPKTDLLVAIDMEAFKKWTHYSLKANGVDLGLHGVLRAQTKKFVIFKEFFHGRKLLLEFKVEQDNQNLSAIDSKAIFFRSFMATGLPTIERNKVISMAASSEGFNHFVGGWSYSEASGTWTDGNYSTLRLGKIDNLKSNVNLQFEVESAVPENEVSFFINEQLQKTVKVTGAQQIQLPLANNFGEKPIDLIIKSTKSFQDKEQGRSLGLLFKSMAINDNKEGKGLN